MREFHGMRRTLIYTVWRNMKTRCYSPSCKDYKHYGGRGIGVCARWRNSFMAFYEDMGDRPSAKYSLDRIDNDGDYEPSNCRWATIKQQHSNMRSNRHLKLNGTTKTLKDWAHSLNMSSATIWNRIARGWSVEKALTTPIARRYLEFNGETKTMAEWARFIGISQSALSHRIGLGWSVERALTQPVRRKKKCQT